MIHELKTLPKYFEAVVSGKKSFEVRKADRPFHEGDLLALNEYDCDNMCYTGRSCIVYIDYILNSAGYCKEGYVILSIKACTLYKHDRPYNPARMCADYCVPLATKEYRKEAAEDAK